jgi:hypothetical protein
MIVSSGAIVVESVVVSLAEGGASRNKHYIIPPTINSVHYYSFSKNNTFKLVTFIKIGMVLLVLVLVEITTSS